MTTLEHRDAAEVLFATGQTPPDAIGAAELIARTCRRDADAVQHAAAVLAQEYGDHPAQAAARMARCLELTPPRVVVPEPLPPGALELIGCETDDCPNPGPYLLVDKRLYCARCATGAVLAETAGPDHETEDADG